MRVQLRVSAIVLTLAATTLVVQAERPSDAAPLPAGPAVTVAGRVVDTNGQPVANASVHGARTDRFALTNGNGDYTLSVPSGTAAVIAAKEGFAFASAVRPATGNANLQLTPQSVKPRGEYPRPDADRRPFTNNAWLSLNGTWSFDFDPSNVGITQAWYGTGRQYTKAIQVPFPYQSLAAFGEQEYATDELYRGVFDGYTGAVWYRRTFTVPQSFAGQQTRLRIGATNWGVEAWLDGNATRVLNDTSSGDTEVSAVLGNLAPGSQHTLAIRVVTPVADLGSTHPIGRRDVFGNSGGIWQSVWIEPVGAATLQQPRVSSNLTFDGRTPTSASATVAIATNGAATGLARVAIKNPAGTQVASANVTLASGAGQATITIPNPQLWDLGQPHLYTADVVLDDGAGGVRDGQRVTFGLRKIERKPPRDGVDYQYVWLNNRPIFIRGALDQGYNPWGHHTPTGEVTGPDFTTGTEADPAQGSILYDLKAAKRMGFNLVRSHVKIFEPAYYHWADKLGLLIWLEMPNSGRGASLSSQSLAYHERLLGGALRMHRNHPSIVIWGLFNEGWGVANGPNKLQPLAITYIKNTGAPTVRREFSNVLVVDNSACCENGHTSVTDINDVHNGYWGFEEWKPYLDQFSADIHPGSTRNMDDGTAQAGQPWLLSEITYSFGHQLTHMSAMRWYPKLAGYIGVELTGIELEQGTPITYDRQDRGETFVDHTGAQRGPEMVHRDDHVIINQEAMVNVKTPASVTLPLDVSHFSDHNLQNAQLKWKVGGYGDNGRLDLAGAVGTQSISPQRYGVTDVTDPTVQIPAHLRSGFVWVWIEAGGQTVAESYVTFVDTTPRPGTFDPMSPIGTSWTGGTHGEVQCGPQHLTGFGTGYFEYTAKVPADVQQNGGTLQFEASSAEAPRPLSTLGEDDISATKERRFPTRLTVTVDGTAVRSLVLPDDPFDSKGVAARHFGRYRAGLGNHYGYQVAVPLPPSVVAGKTSVVVRLESNGGGLRVFGQHSGDRGIAPRMVTGSGFDAVPPAVPTTTDRPGISFASAEMTSTANTGTAVVSITNDTDQTVTGVQARLNLPTGWTATLTGPPPASIPPAGFAHAQFSVDGPDGAGGTVPVTATTVWTNASGQHSVQVDALQRQFASTDINNAKGVSASLSGDSKAELICVGDGLVRAWHNKNGSVISGWGFTREWDSEVVGNGFSDPKRTRFADLDNDGKSEIIHLQADGVIQTWKNVRGFGDMPWNGSKVLGTLGATPPERVYFADLNGDGKAEMLTLEANGTVTGKLNVGGFADNPWGTAIPVATFDPATPPDRLYWADLTGDKRAEVMIMHSTGANAGKIEAWYNANGFQAPPWGPPPSGGAASRIVADGGTSPGTHVKFADLSGDGKADVVVVQPDGRPRAWTNWGGGFKEYPWAGNHVDLTTTITDPARLMFG